MAVLPIRTFGDPVLRRRAAEVSGVDEAVRKLMHDMSDTVIEAPGFEIETSWILRGFAAGKGVEQHGREEADEACLSLPGLSYPVVRSAWVKVTGLNDRGKLVELVADDWTARILQHEIDHLDGVLFIDRIAADLQREARRRLREQALSGVPIEPVAAL